MTGCSSADRDSALRKLVAFSRRRAFRKDWKDVNALYPSQPITDDSSPQDLLFDALQIGEVAQPYFLLDHLLRSGETLVRKYVDERRAKLTESERFYLEVLAESSVKFYQIRRVVPGEAMILHDLWSRKNLHVKEAAMSRDLRPMEILVTRTLFMPQGPEVIASGRYVFPDLCYSDLTRWLKTLPHELGETALFKLLPPLIHARWRRFVSHPPVPFPGIATSEALNVHQDHFELLDRRKLECALIDSHNFVRDPEDDASRNGDAWCWSIPVENENPLDLGSLILGESTVTLETNNEEQGLRGRELLEALAPGALCHRGSSWEAPPGQFGEGPTGPESPGPGEPGTYLEPWSLNLSDEWRQHIHENLSSRFKAWIDQPLPQLGNKTPREVARTDPARVTGILEGFETLSEVWLGYDSSWVWEELRLRRPE